MSDANHDAVAELRARRDRDAAASLQLQPRIEADLSQRHDEPETRELRNLRLEVIETASDFLRRRFVVGRCASHGSGDVRVDERQTVADMLRRWNVCKAVTMKRPHQEVA